MHLVEGVGGPLDIVLSGNGRLDHGPFNGRCKARNWKTLISLFPVLHFKACPSVRSILHTVGQRSLHLSLIMMVRQGLFPPPFSAHSLGFGPPKRGRESTEHLNHWREFPPHPIPNSCSPRMIVVAELWPRMIVSGEEQPLRHSTYGLTGHTLAKYPTKKLPRARSIKGMAIGMGTLWHHMVSRPNELVGTRNVRKSKRKE